MPVPLQIRNAAETDVPLILSLIRELAEFERLADRVVATEAHLRRNLFGERPYAEVLIGEQSGVAVAFCLFFHNYSTFLGRPGIYLEDLFVKPEWRGQGYGKALLARLARLAKERDCGRVEWAVLKWNAPAIQFYESLGAIPMDDWTIYRLIGDPLDRLASFA